MGQVIEVQTKDLSKSFIKVHIGYHFCLKKMKGMPRIQSSTFFKKCPSARKKKVVDFRLMYKILSSN